MMAMAGWARKFIPRVQDDSMASAPEAPIRDTFRRFWPLTEGWRGWMALSLLLTTIVPVLATLTIALYGRLVDDVLVAKNFAALGPIAAAYVALTVAGGIVGFGRASLSEWITLNILLELRLRLFAHLQRLPMDVFDTRRHGDTVVRLTDDVDDVQTLLVSGVTSALGYVLKILLFSGALVMIDPRLALISAIVAPPFWWASRRFAARIKRLAREQRHRDGEFTALVEESIANLPLVQAYNREASEQERFRREARHGVTVQLALARTSAIFAPLGDLIELAGVLVVIGFGTWELTHGRITLGELLAFLAYLSQLYGPVRGLSKLTTAVHAASASAERVAELLESEVRVVDPVDPVSPAEPLGRLELQGVTYRYPRQQRDAIVEVSLVVEPGEMVAVVGGSGAGKSTVARLLLRFDDPDEGRILLDGVDLREMLVSEVRQRITLLPQETLLFAGTIREAITFGKADATDAEIEAAARQAGAYGFIEALPDGYGTQLGDRARTLSGGQRQRIALGRALVRGAPVLVLDEPTTGLDAETAELALTAIRAAAGGRTIVAITHDLIAASAADRIVVFEAGRIAEVGTHETLLARGGVYARLWRTAPASVHPRNGELAGSTDHRSDLNGPAGDGSDGGGREQGDASVFAFDRGATVAAD